MKVDKETLLRNRFWVALGIYLPLVLIALIYLSTSVAGDLDSQRDRVNKFKESLGQIIARTKGKTDSEMELLRTKTVKLDERREELWKDAWAMQDGMQVWPKAIDEAAVQEKYGGKPMAERKFGEALPNDLCALYAQNNVYDAQYEELAATFREDLQKLGKGKGYNPVRFKDGWTNVIQHVEEWKTRPPSYKDVWVAQEDFWVQRELLLALHAANKSVARFKKVKPAKDIDPNDPLQGSFENSYWRLDLKIVKKDQGFVLTGQISNPETGEDGKPRPKQMLQIGLLHFWLYLDKDPTAKPVPFAVQGEGVAPGQSVPLRERALSVELAPQGIFGVEQVIQPNNAPIRRIDQLTLGAQSHRTYQGVLKEPAFLRDVMAKAVAPKAAPGKEPMPATLTENGILSRRYYNAQTDKTEVRRMPIALHLVVDQAHIPEVEAALVSSRLRFQITQVGWQHFRDSLVTDEEKGRKGPKLPRPNPSNPTDSRAEEQSTNLVELTIYGIASIYDRPGERKAETPPKDKPKSDKSDKSDKTDKRPKGDAKKDQSN